MPIKKAKAKKGAPQGIPSKEVTEKIKEAVAKSGGKLNHANLIQNLCNPNNPFYIGRESSTYLKHNKQVINTLF